MTTLHTDVRPGGRCQVTNPANGATIGTDASTLERIEGPMAWVLVRPSVRPGRDHDRACYPLDWIRPATSPDAVSEARAAAIAAMVGPVLADAGVPELADEPNPLVAAAAWLLVLAADDRAGGRLTADSLDAVVADASDIASGWVG